MPCPKCNYERKKSDIAPVWQCPKCGVAVEKYTQLVEGSDRRLISYDRDAEKRKDVRRKQFKTFYFVIPIVIFGYMVPEWGQTSIALMWFSLAAWALSIAFVMRSTGYFILDSYRVISKDERPFNFKLYMFICIISGVASIVMAIRSLL